MSAKVDRREFLKQAGGATLAVTAGTLAVPAARAADGSGPEEIVKQLYASLSAAQKQAVAFDWDYVDPKRGLLRTRIAANWRITEPAIHSDFYTRDQQRMIRDIFEGITCPDWHRRFDKQIQDDDDGFGTHQTIALFGRPGSGKFQFVLTGRHMTVRCDGHSAAEYAFGGPIFYGHAASGFHEKPGHPGNIFWPQAQAANTVYHMLDSQQQKEALLPKAPRESAVAFHGAAGPTPGIPVAEFHNDQKEQLHAVLEKLVEPYREDDRQRVVSCLKAQGGLEHCHLAFYQEGAAEGDRVWDIWRLEGPAFVWHFRGTPHVHVWVHVADNPRVKLNA
jgi:hypothetical protein